MKVLLTPTHDLFAVATWHSVTAANFPCPTLDLQLMGDHLCG